MQEDDYYLEGDYVVFTEQYHRRRGYCCRSQCRHCPWKPKPKKDKTEISKNDDVCSNIRK
jgi:hypothetical protein